MNRTLAALLLISSACASSSASTRPSGGGDSDKETKETKVALLDGTSQTVGKVDVAELIPEGMRGYTFVLGTPVATEHPIPIKITLSEKECDLTLTSITRIGPGPKGTWAAEYAFAPNPNEGCVLKPRTPYQSSLGRVKAGDTADRLRPTM